MENVYKNLSAISVADKVEKKGRFDYLSWAWAWHYVKQEYPTANRTVYENDMGMPYFTDGKFANVKVGITINGVEHIDYLPVLDNANRSIPITKVTSFDVNNAIQRATAKAIAMPSDENRCASDALRPEPAPTIKTDFFIFFPTLTCK